MPDLPKRDANPMQKTRLFRQVAWAWLFGLNLYGLGTYLSYWHGGGLALRLCALLLFAYAAWRQRSITAWTFFSIVAGLELGFDLPRIAANLHVLAEIFLRLVRMLIAPLILGSLTTAIARHGKGGGLGRVAMRSFIYFEVVTTLALLLGAVAINLTKAGVGVHVPALALDNAAIPATGQPGFAHFLLNLFPENIALAVAQNQILQVAVFAMLFGLALSRLPEQRKAPLLAVLESLTETMFQLARLVMYLAPLATGAALSYTVATLGLGTLLPLAKLLGTFYASVAAFCVLVLLPILLLAKVPLRRFIMAIAEPAALGFATSTSEAALPLAMDRMEAFGVPRWVVSFVIPAGYSFNMDGSSLYLSVAAIFCAQAAGISLSLGQQAFMLGTLMLTSKGVAGVPRATLLILLGSVAAFNIPTAPVLMILGIDALIDMGRTAVNVTGNCLACAVIGKWEARSSDSAL